MIKATVTGQVLNVKTPLIFSGTYNYIKGEIDFNEDWSLATARYARFYLDSEHDYTVELDEQNRFGYREEDHIALSKGRWKFWLVGYAIQEGGTAEQIITTNAVDLVSKITGESFPELQPSIAEMTILMARRFKEEAEIAKRGAETAEKNAETAKTNAQTFCIQAMTSSMNAGEYKRQASASAENAEKYAAWTKLDAESAARSALFVQQVSESLSELGLTIYQDENGYYIDDEMRQLYMMLLNLNNEPEKSRSEVDVNGERFGTNEIGNTMSDSKYTYNVL